MKVSVSGMRSKQCRPFLYIVRHGQLTLLSKIIRQCENSNCEQCDKKWWTLPNTASPLTVWSEGVFDKVIFLKLKILIISTTTLVQTNTTMFNLLSLHLMMVINKLNFKPNKHELYLLSREKEREKEREKIERKREVKERENFELINFLNQCKI